MNQSQVEELLRKNQEISKWLEQQIENFQIDSESNCAPENAKLKVLDKFLEIITDIIKEDNIKHSDSQVKNTSNLQKNGHRHYFSETDLTSNLHQSSSSCEVNQAAMVLEKDKILYNNLTTIVKIANDSIKLLPTAQSKEIKSNQRISNIRASEGPLTNLINLNTPVQTKPERKYLAPRKILKPSIKQSNCTRTVNKIKDDLSERDLAKHRTESKIILSPPRYTSSPELNLDRNIIKNQVSHDNLTTIIKVANDLVNLIPNGNKNRSQIAKVELHNPFIIDVTTPTQVLDNKKALTPKLPRFVQPKKVLRSSTYNNIQKLPKTQSTYLSSTKEKSASSANLTITLKDKEIN